jgi:hypothetical protein
MARTTTIARTRAKAAAAATAAAGEKKKTTTTTSSSSIYTLASESENPPKLFILPKTASPSARIVTLQNPRYNKPTRYLVCPETGFFEFTTISPPKSTPRSWLIQPTAPSNDTTTTSPQPTAQTTQSPTLHLATPYDPLFLLLPALCTSNGSSSSPQQKQKRMFLSHEDHLDSTPDPAKHMAELLASCPTTKDLVEARIKAVCDVVQAGDESMYRVNEARLLGEVLGKARGMVGGGGGGLLPGSMEERFVRKELEAPVLGVRVTRGAAGNGDGSGSGSVTPSLESQASVGSAQTAVSAESEGPAASTAATSAVEEDVASAITAPDEVVKLQRLRVAFNFICSSYVAPSVAGVLKKSLVQATDLVDFKPLDEYLERLTKLRQEAVAARSTDYSRKRVADEEDDERAEKRRKKEAEEKSKKANMSRGVKNLMKANTSGMKKMSDFFKKKA